MRKSMTVFLSIGIICLLSGMGMIVFHLSPVIIPVTMCSIGGALISMFIFTRGDTGPRDEMVKRVDALSAYYSWVATFYCLIVLSFIQYFYPLLLSGWILWIIMMVMSLSFMLFRSYLLRRGKTE
jgi:hypothetical protein